VLVPLDLARYRGRDGLRALVDDVTDGLRSLVEASPG
jgi:hypothetical protein